MKTLFVALTLLTSFTAHAAEGEIQASEILTALILAAPTAEVVSESDEKIDLAEQLGSALAVSHLDKRGAKSVVLNNVSGKCVSTDVGRYGIAYYDCSLYITDGDYKVTKHGYQGPELESSRIYTFEATKKIGEEGKLRIHGKKVKISFAG